MFISNFLSGILLAKKNLTVCAVYHMVRSPVPVLPCKADLARMPEVSADFAPDDTDLIMLCYSVDSKDSLENVESKWVGEIADNCPGVKLVLVALKCDLREGGDDENAEAEAEAEDQPAAPQPGEKRNRLINYDQGLEVARRIHALRYLECSAMKNRGVNEAFTEAARVALSVKKDREDSKCTVM